MVQIDFNNEQKKAIEYPLSDSLFLEGPVSSGKTTTALARFGRLLESSEFQNILILVPQKSLSKPYLEFLNQQEFYSGSQPLISTISGFVRQMISRFWLMISRQAGFSNPKSPPHFLSLETAQYIMGKVVEPFLRKGYFSTVTIEKPRLYSQILDNLNKTAVVPFPLEEISVRLRNSAGIDNATLTAFDQAQECALAFREYCLINNLIDFSLLISTFRKHVWNEDICQAFVQSGYQAMIVENIEEDFPVSHDFLRDLIKLIPASTVIFDSSGGYRSFLGADPVSAKRLRDVTSSTIKFTSILDSTQSMELFSAAMESSILRNKFPVHGRGFEKAYQISTHQFYPQMITRICGQIAELIANQNIEPQEIVILAPYISDAVRFAFAHDLDKLGVPHNANRPSQIYINHPIIRAFLTLIKIILPQWKQTISKFDIRNMILTFFKDINLIQAHLLTEVLYSAKEKRFHSFDGIQNTDLQERISFQFGEKFEELLSWLSANPLQPDEPLDIFVSRLFGELLSRKGYEFFDSAEAARVTHKFIQSIRSFRDFSTDFQKISIDESNIEYLATLENGLLPSSFFNWDPDQTEGGIQIEPAHAFLMQNRKCDYQFWVDAGSLGWWERLNQPLTNPYLLRNRPNPESLWTEADEFKANQETMNRVIQGLIKRCKKQVFINIVAINEYGNEQRGPLLFALQNLQKQSNLNNTKRNV